MFCTQALVKRSIFWVVFLFAMVFRLPLISPDMQVMCEEARGVSAQACSESHQVGLGYRAPQGTNDRPDSEKYAEQLALHTGVRRKTKKSIPPGRDFFTAPRKKKPIFHFYVVRKNTTENDPYRSWHIFCK